MFSVFRMAICCTLSSVLFAITAGAHHSNSMFDENRTVTVIGTVKEFQYTHPHCWLVVTEQLGSGADAREWRIESGAPTMMARMGISKSSFPVGQKLTVTFHPLKDGRAAGSLMTAIRPDGTVLKLFAPPPVAPVK